MPYPPIENHGMIGDMHTAALVEANGRIDWLCLPHFDSPAVFAALLDSRKGGAFEIAPVGDDITCKQFYWPETNVLITRFLGPAGAAELTDFMPVGAKSGATARRGDDADQPYVSRVIRRITALRGPLSFRMCCRPAFDYGRQDHELTIGGDCAAFRSPALNLCLTASVAMENEDGAAAAEFTLAQGDSAVFVLHCGEPEHPRSDPAHHAERAEAAFNRTVAYWRDWLSRCQYTGRWREMMHRSALALKLLTFEPTGAIVAAPTCGLPEEAGGERNWDYRYTWIRDAAFTVYAFLRLGYSEEAERFMDFLATVCKAPGPNGPLQIMYGIDGRRELSEQTLDHLEGYMSSKPVRIGNGAFDQIQLDIYGELLDAAYLYNKHGAPISYDMWTSLRQMADWVCENWRQPDQGVWEVRGPERQFVYSKLMCWVALDRAVRLADKRSFPAARQRWLNVRDEIYEEIMTQGWSDGRQAFVQHYESGALDAANLMLPLTFFVSPTDPRMLSTLDATLEPLERGGLTANSLVYRYNTEETDDGVDGEEGTFNICTFWLVEALTRAGRHDPDRLNEARMMFERMLGFANHVGLYAEQIGHRGEALGNFPQAFTHLSLISAAYNLDRALGPGA